MSKLYRIFIVLLLLSVFVIPIAKAVTTVEGSNASSIVSSQLPKKDDANNKLRCTDAPPGLIIHLPGGTTLTANACSTSTLVSTDICSNTASGIPCLDTNTRISTTVVPPLPFVVPSGMSCTGKTDTTTSTSTATSTGTLYSTAAIPPTCTLTATSAATVAVFPNSTKTWTGTVTVTQTDIGTATPTPSASPIAGSNTNTSTGTGTDVLLNNWVNHARGDVPTSQVINSHTLTNTNINITYSDVGADASGAAAARAAPGTCSANQYATATTTGGITCSAISESQVTNLTTDLANRCQTSGTNCPSAATLGGITGSGTTGNYAKFSGTGSVVAGSLGEDSFTVTTTKNFSPGGYVSSGSYIAGSNINSSGITSAMTATPTAGAPPLADGSGHLNSWVTGRFVGVATQVNAYSVTTGTGGSYTYVIGYSGTFASGSTMLLSANATVTPLSSGIQCYVRITVDGTQINPEASFASDPGGSHFINLTHLAAYAGSGAHTFALEMAATSGGQCNADAGRGYLRVDVYQ